MRNGLSKEERETEEGGDDDRRTPNCFTDFIGATPPSNAAEAILHYQIAFLRTHTWSSLVMHDQTARKIKAARDYDHPLPA